MRIEPVEGRCEGGREIGFGKRFGQDRTGAGLADRVENVLACFAGHQHEGDTRQGLVSTHRREQFDARHVRQIHCTDHQGRRHRPHRAERRRTGIGTLHAADAELAQRLAHGTLLHRRWFDDQHIEILERSVQAKALPHGKTPPLYAAATRSGAPRAPGVRRTPGALPLDAFASLRRVRAKVRPPFRRPAHRVWRPSSGRYRASRRHPDRRSPAPSHR